MRGTARILGRPGGRGKPKACMVHAGGRHAAHPRRAMRCGTSHSDDSGVTNHWLDRSRRATLAGTPFNLRAADR